MYVTRRGVFATHLIDAVTTVSAVAAQLWRLVCQRMHCQRTVCVLSGLHVALRRICLLRWHGRLQRGVPFG